MLSIFASAMMTATRTDDQAVITRLPVSKAKPLNRRKAGWTFWSWWSL